MLAFVQTIICSKHKPQRSVVLMFEALGFEEKELKVAFAKKTTYKVVLFYGAILETMRTDISLL